MANDNIKFVPYSKRINSKKLNNNIKKNNDKVISIVLTMFIILIVILLFFVSTLRNIEDVNNNKQNDIIKVIFKK